MRPKEASENPLIPDTPLVDVCAAERATLGRHSPAAHRRTGPLIQSAAYSTARNGGQAGTRGDTDKAAAIAARPGGSTLLCDHGQDLSPVTIRRLHRRPERTLRLPNALLAALRTRAKPVTVEARGTRRSACYPHTAEDGSGVGPGSGWDTGDSCEGPVRAAAARQDGDELLAGHPVHLCPGGRHPWTGDDLVDAAAHESLHPLASEPETPRRNPPIRVKPFCDSSAAA
jgi:hypothetical protein